MNIQKGDKSKKHLATEIESDFQTHADGDKTKKRRCEHGEMLLMSLFCANTDVFINIRATVNILKLTLNTDDSSGSKI